MNIDFEAREELLAAAIWYEEQRPGLGDQLLAAVNETLERIDAEHCYFDGCRGGCCGASCYAIGATFFSYIPSTANKILEKPSAVSARPQSR